MLLKSGTRNREPETANGERGTGNGERGTGNGERGTGNGERGTGNGERGTGNGERGTGNGERGHTGTYAGMGRDLLTLVANFKPGMGELGCFCTFVAGYPGKDPRDL